ncbi:CHAT domain-containing protein [Streptomyces sp. NPDC053513]|uniref:CHAT domain-containing tetratricopeptide repeat protein n=1 Tax=unclassified Streptomyces TaxID=2593676 RepID=UPI0037D6E131
MHTEIENRTVPVVARLSRAAEYTPILEPSAMEDARRLAAVLPEDYLGPAREALGLLYWMRAVMRHEAGLDGSEEIRCAVRAFTAHFMAGVGNVPQELLPLIAHASFGLAVELTEKSRTSDEAHLIDDCVMAWRRIVGAVRQESSEVRALNMSKLANALTLRAHLRDQLVDLDEAIEVNREAAALLPTGALFRLKCLRGLCLDLRARFKAVGEQEDIDASIAAAQELLASLPADGEHTRVVLCMLAESLLLRHDRSGAQADLRQGIALLRRGTKEMAPDERHWGSLLLRLGTALLDIAELDPNAPELDEAIEVARTLVRTPSDDLSEVIQALELLRSSLVLRFTRNGNRSDIDDAVEAGQRAMQSTTGLARAMCASNLCSVLLVRAANATGIVDLDEAINISRLATADMGSEYLPELRTNLGAALRDRYDRRGDPEDLSEAITVFQEVLSNTPEHAPQRAGFVANLVTALGHERSTTSWDLGESVRRAREALRLTPEGHPFRAQNLTNLSSALRNRYDHLGAQADIDEAVESGRAGVAACAAGDPSLPVYRVTVAMALVSRAERSRSLSDLDEAIDLTRRALAATPRQHNHRRMYLSALGITLRHRFSYTRDRAELDEAVDALREAVELTPADSPMLAYPLTSLTNALAERFSFFRDPADIDEAVERGRRAVASSPEDLPVRLFLLNNLGGALHLRIAAGSADVQADNEEAFAVMTQALNTKSGPPSWRAFAAQSAAALAYQHGRTGQVADLMEAAVRLLPDSVHRRLHRSDQQYELGIHARLAADAAALVLEADGPAGAERALTLLEQGRGVLLSQSLDTRTDLTDLRATAPDLADEYIQLRDILDTPQSVDAVAESSFLQSATDRHDLAEQFDSVVARIRAHDGFSTFHLPPQLTELTAEAQHGPIAVINVSRYRSDALLVTSEGVTLLPLPGLDMDTVDATVTTFHQALRDAHDTTLPPEERAAAQATQSRVLEWLWDAAAGPVLDRLGFTTAPPMGGDWPRTWWVTSGLLSLLPVHAAGYHSAQDSRTVMDRVASSYTPTIRALRHARRHAAVPVSAKALVVAMEATPGAAPLRHAATETEALRRHFPEATVLTGHGTAHGTSMSPSAATKANVLSHLPDAAIVHFACHGAHDPTDPSRSKLLLQDHQRDPLTVSSLAGVRLSGAALAYLSACRTAFNENEATLDESVHLTTAFHLAGFRHVIGSLWEIDDWLAARISDGFYAKLLANGGSLENFDVARALHDEIRAQRAKYVRAPSLWAAHIHVGP